MTKTRLRCRQIATILDRL